MASSLVKTSSSALTPTADYKIGIEQQKITRFLVKARFAVGGTMVAGILSGLVGLIGLVVSFISHAEAMQHVLHISENAFQTLMAIGVVGGPVAAFVGGLMLEEVAHTRYTSWLSRKLFHRQLRKENAQLGWRPRHDAPKLSKDELTYPRYAVDKKVSEQYGSNELFYYLALTRYHFDEKWQKSHPVEDVFVEIGDEEKLVNELERLRVKADQLNNDEASHYYDSINDARVKAQMQEEARLVQAQESVRREEQRQAAQDLLDRL